MPLMVCPHCGYAGDAHVVTLTLDCAPIAEDSVPELLATAWAAAFDVVRRADRVLASWRHWITSLLTLLAWDAVGAPLVGVLTVVGLVLVVNPFVRLLVPDRHGEVGRGDLRTEIARALMAGGFALASVLAAASIAALGWVRFPVILIFVAAAAAELRDGVSRLRSVGPLRSRRRR